MKQSSPECRLQSGYAHWLDRIIAAAIKHGVSEGVAVVIEAAEKDLETRYGRKPMEPDEL